MPGLITSALFGSSIGRLALAGLAIVVALTFVIERAERRGVAEQVARQERVDGAAVRKATAARKKVRAASKKAAKAKKPETNDGWRRD